MRIGRLRHKVEVYKEILSQNEFGEDVPSRVLVGRYACAVDHDRNSTEGEDVRQNQHSITLRTRFSRDFGVVNNDMIALFGGHEWDIESVINPQFRNRMLIMECKLRVSK